MLSATEVANQLIDDLVTSSEIDPGFVLVVGTLPEEISQEFYRLMRAIEEADFEWVPPRIGLNTNQPDPSEYSEKLRQISALLP